MRVWLALWQQHGSAQMAVLGNVSDSSPSNMAFWVMGLSYFVSPKKPVISVSVFNNGFVLHEDKNSLTNKLEWL